QRLVRHMVLQMSESAPREHTRARALPKKCCPAAAFSDRESKSPLGTTQNFWLRLNFGKAAPQFRQKQRVNPGLPLASTNRPIRSSPRVHETESSGKPRFATWTDPDDF